MQTHQFLSAWRLEIRSGLSGERLEVTELGLIAEGITKEQIKILGREVPGKLLMG